MRPKQSILSTFVLAVIVGSLGAAAAGFGFQPARVQKHSPPTRVRDWDSIRAGDQTLRSPASATVTIVEFSDFQCPFCRRFADTLRALRTRFPGDVRIVFRNYPLWKIHPDAVPAALGGVCAAEQGRFEEFHDAVFDAQNYLGSTPVERFATWSDVSDSAAFELCLQSAAARAHISRDIALGNRLHLVGTPSVLINGWRLQGTPTLTELDSAVRAELDRGRRIQSGRQRTVR